MKLLSSYTQVRGSEKHGWEIHLLGNFLEAEITACKILSTYSKEAKPEMRKVF